MSPTTWTGIALLALSLVMHLGRYVYRAGYRDGQRHGEAMNTHPGETIRPRPDR